VKGAQKTIFFKVLEYFMKKEKAHKNNQMIPLARL
jgi:hypothetical protein